MKHLLLILGIILASCGPMPSQDNIPESRPSGRVVGKSYHYGVKHCPGHALHVTKYDMQEEGHDMWLYISFVEGTSINTITVIHSPNCKKCNPETTSIFDEPSHSSSDWGW